VFFLGTFDYAMDERGRLPLPPRYRDAFREGMVLSQGSPDRCLHVYTEAAFEQRALQYLAESAMRRKGRVLRHALFPGSHHAELDKQNRVLVPAPLRDYAGLSNKVMVIGAGDWLEVWAPEEYEAEMARVAEQLPGTLESVELRER
jgi:MraZ protein